MEYVIHILKTINGWTAKCGGLTANFITSANKNLVVNHAVAVSKKLCKRATLIIHSLDGRILETRSIREPDRE